MMFRRTAASTLGVLAITLTLIGCQTMTGRTAGRYIDDQTLTAEVKGKLIGDRLANLTRVNVTTQNGVVYLTGNADSADRAERAADLARSVTGVREVVNQIQVASATPPAVGSTPSQPASGSTASQPASPTVVTAAPPVSNVAAGQPPVDMSGEVARYDAQTGIVTFQDGRMVRVPPTAAVWRAERASDMQPGQHVYLRNAVPVGLQSSATPAAAGGLQSSATPAAAGAWHFGTVSRVDTAANVLYLSDGTALQIQPSTRLTVNGQPIALSQVQPGAELAWSTTPSTSTTGASALPRATVGSASSSQIVIFNSPTSR